MATQVLFPKIGFSMSEGVILEWLAADGAEIKEGTPLFVVESDKSTNEIEAPASGKLRILQAANETIPVGAVIAEIG